MIRKNCIVFLNDKWSYRYIYYYLRAFEKIQWESKLKKKKGSKKTRKINCTMIKPRQNAEKIIKLDIR